MKSGLPTNNCRRRTMAMPIVAHCLPDLMEDQRPDRQISDGPPATAAVGPLALPTVALCRAGIGLLSGSRFKKSGLMAKGANEKVV